MIDYAYQYAERVCGPAVAEKLAIHAKHDGLSLQRLADQVERIKDEAFMWLERHDRRQTVRKP